MNILLALLATAILIVVIIVAAIIVAGKKNGEEKLKREPRLQLLQKNTYMLPKELFENDLFPNAIMNDRARTLIQKKYLPQMIGVPSTGQPFRMYLPRPISDELIYEILEAVAFEDEDDMFFVKTMNPPTLIGYRRQISGQMIDYCDKNAVDCDPVDLYFYQGTYSHDEPNV